jgi:hypothetical protein
MASGPTKPFHWRDREHDVHPEGSTAGLVQESGNRQKSVALGERHTRPEPRTQRLNERAAVQVGFDSGRPT